MYTYGLPAVPANLSARRSGNRQQEGSRDLLPYFLEEARAVGKRNKRLLPDRKERLHRVLFKRIASG